MPFNSKTSTFTYRRLKWQAFHAWFQHSWYDGQMLEPGWDVDLQSSKSLKMMWSIRVMRQQGPSLRLSLNKLFVGDSASPARVYISIVDQIRFARIVLYLFGSLDVQFAIFVCLLLSIFLLRLCLLLSSPLPFLAQLPILSLQLCLTAPALRSAAAHATKPVLEKQTRTLKEAG